MDTEAFFRWALDRERTVEDRYTVELLVDQGVACWNSRRNIFKSASIDESIERSRERKLNPAYQPRYSEEDLRKAVEYLAEVKQWWFCSDRPLGSVAALRFLTSLEFLTVGPCQLTDLAPLTELPALRMLSIGTPGHDFGNPVCEDFTPLARCGSLRELVLGFNVHWPDLTGLDHLRQLESLTLSGNLLAMPRGASFPNVRKATLQCMPLAARNVAALPQLPACEFLTLSGVERLDGIEQMPALRNLKLLGPFRSFAPLEPLRELTCLTVDCPDHRDPARQPREVTPIARLPKLLYFQIGPQFTFHDMPRDYSPLAEAPALRELVVRRCPPVEMEVAAINAGLQPWDDLFLAPTPSPVPPLRMIVAPHKDHPQRGEEHRGPGETGLIDIGLRECEGRWVGDFARRHISEQIGHSDWGTAAANGSNRVLQVTIESFEMVERLPEILEAARQVIARVQGGYNAAFMIFLRVRRPEPTPAQKQLDAQFREKMEKLDYEQTQRDREEYLERLHQLELKKQQGVEINPDEFSPSERQPYPERPQERESDDEDDDGDADIAVDQEPEPLYRFFDDEHPLAENYRLMGWLTLEEAWFLAHHRGLAVHLMGREPDVDIPDDSEEQP